MQNCFTKNFFQKNEILSKYELPDSINSGAGRPPDQRPGETSQRPSESITADTKPASCSPHASSRTTPLGKCALRRANAGRAGEAGSAAGTGNAGSSTVASAHATSTTGTNACAGALTQDADTAGEHARWRRTTHLR
ncbi:MAG: hypothetical protein ACXWJK_14420, partial [Burkholderiaceae bacterium]